MIYLRQSTASQEIPLGRFVDSIDGDTEETGLTIANTDIKLWKTGATSLASKNSGGATHMANGEYYCVLDATDTNTIGPMKVTVHVSGALYVQVFCCVLASAVYDVMFGTTAISTLTSANVTTAVPTANQNADALLGRNIAGGSSTGRIVSEALYALRNKWRISSGTRTVYTTDDVTPSWTSVVTATPSAQPVTGDDPSGP